MKNHAFFVDLPHTDLVQKVRMENTNMIMEQISVFIAGQHQLVHAQRAHMESMKNN